MSFETGAELSLTVSESDLQNVKQQIQDEIGTTAVGVTDGGSMSAQSAGGSGGGGARRARRSMRLAETQTEHLEDIALYLESIDDVLSEDGLLGGGGGLPGSGIFAEVVGAGAETAGDVGVEAGDAVADAVSDVLTGTVSTALGTSISSAIDDSTVSVEPNPLPVEGDGSSGNSITVSPTLKPTFRPTFEPTVDVSPELDLPDFNFGGGGGAGPVRVDESQLPLPVRRDPLPVEDIEPLPVEDVGPITVVVGGGSKGSRPNSSGDGRNIAEKFTDAFGNIPIIGPPAEEFSENVGRRSRELTPFVSTQESGGESTGGRGNLSVDVTHSPTYNMEVDPRQLNQLADRIVSELESRVERDIDEIRDDLDEVEGDIAELERDVRSGSGVR